LAHKRAATGPDAVIFASSQVHSRAMARKGLVFSLGRGGAEHRLFPVVVVHR